VADCEQSTASPPEVARWTTRACSTAECNERSVEWCSLRGMPRLALQLWTLDGWIKVGSVVEIDDDDDDEVAAPKNGLQSPSLFGAATGVARLAALK
jgi:hypothetical protein